MSVASSVASELPAPSPVGRRGLLWFAVAQIGQLLAVGLGDLADRQLAPGILVERALPLLYGLGLLVSALEFAALALLARLRSVGPWSLAAVLVGVLAWACFLGAWALHRFVPLEGDLHPAFWVSFAGGLLSTPYTLLVVVALHRVRDDVAGRLSSWLVAGVLLTVCAALTLLVLRRLVFLVPGLELQQSGALAVLSSALAYATPALLFLAALQLRWTVGTHLRGASAH